jgi:hypothetical protein
VRNVVRRLQRLLLSSGTSRSFINPLYNTMHLTTNFAAQQWRGCGSSTSFESGCSRSSNRCRRKSLSNVRPWVPGLPPSRDSFSSRLFTLPVHACITCQPSLTVLQLFGHQKTQTRRSHAPSRPHRRPVRRCCPSFPRLRAGWSHLPRADRWRLL